MVRRPMTRLAVTVAAAGTICAFGASVASAAPHASWLPAGKVPGAITNDSPGVSSITFPVATGQGQIAGWRGRGNVGPIFYKYRVPGLNKGQWSSAGRVPGSTSSAPAFGSYTDPLGRDAVLAVWTGPLDHHIWYSQGETKANGTIVWTTATFLPKSVANTSTTAGPSVLFTAHAYRVIIAWRGPANHVRFVVGIPVKRGFAWGASRVVPGPSVTPNCKDGVPCTGNTPALAEVNISATQGSVYFFWRQLSTANILYATTADNVVNLAKPVFTAPVTVPAAASLLGPAASDLGLNGFGPLMLAYKAPLGTSVRFQTLAAGVWSAPAPVLGTHTADAPALLLNELATTTPAALGNIVLHVFK
jgi:hypothetical protein